MSETLPIVSVRCMVADEYDRLLVIERPAKGEQSNMLQFPGGKVEDIDGDPTTTPFFQRLINAAQRETQEETGLEVLAMANPELIASYIVPDGKHLGRLYSSYVVRAVMIDGEMGTGNDQHPSSWCSRSVIIGPAASQFTAVTRLAAAAPPTALWTPSSSTTAPLPLAA